MSNKNDTKLAINSQYLPKMVEKSPVQKKSVPPPKPVPKPKSK